jgi:hypothetical protein
MGAGMIKAVQIMGQEMTFVAEAKVQFRGEEIEVPLEVERNGFGRTTLRPDLTEVFYKIRNLKARGIIK